MKCPTCGYLDCKPLGGGQYSCPCCGVTFTGEQTQQSAYIPASRRRPSPSTSSTSAPAMNAGEKVYDACIGGTVAIECHDLGCAGSGFLINRNGEVVTNAHVILGENGQPSRNVHCFVAGATVGARVVKYGNVQDMDIALLQLDSVPYNAKPLNLGNSDTLRNGQTVFHIGNSLGEGLCITSGIISDKERIIDGAKRIMTDVAINPGNSGGPLIDTNCDVVGVCVSARKGAVGMKYSIHLNDALRFLGKR